MNTPAELLEQAPPLRAADFRPSRLAAVVNGLQQRGPEDAIAVLLSAAKSPSLPGDHRLFGVARLLFSCPEAPPPQLGHCGIELGEHAADWPLFPLAVERDVPFLLIDGYELSGKAQSAISYVRLVSERCPMRTRPLAMEFTRQAAEALLASARWHRLFGNDEGGHHAARIREQGRRSPG